MITSQAPPMPLLSEMSPSQTDRLRRASVFVIVEIEILRLVNILRYGGSGVKKTKTYNRRDSQMVADSSTSRPVQGRVLIYGRADGVFSAHPKLQFQDSETKSRNSGVCSRMSTSRDKYFFPGFRNIFIPASCYSDRPMIAALFLDSHILPKVISQEFPFPVETPSRS